MNTKDKLTYGFWLITNLVFLVICALITYLLPVLSAMEDEAAYVLSLTAAGRFQLAWHSFIGVVFVSLIPAGLSYCLSKGIGEFSARVNSRLRMALFMWVALVVSGFIGAVSFWLQIHPIQPV